MGSLEELDKKASEMGRKGRWDGEALEINERILAQDPENFGALFRRGRVYEETGDYLAARRDFEKALQIRLGARIVEERLQEVGEKEQRKREEEERRRREVEAREARKRERLKEIESLTDPHRAEELGEKHQDERSWELSIEAFRKAYALGGTERLLVRIGGACRKSGQPQEAERAYREVLEKDSGSKTAKVGLAAVRADRGFPEEAERLCQEVRYENPRDAYALRALARVYSELGQPKMAQKLWEESEIGY